MITPWLFGLTAVATLLLAGLARRRRWGDAGSGPDAKRKLQPAPVPQVGGIAVLIAYILYTLRNPDPGSPVIPVLVPVLVLVLVLVLAVGILDDVLVGGLRPGPKLLAQGLAVGLPLLYVCLRVERENEALIALALLTLALLAMNVTNTFDNADGAVAAVAAVGLLFGEPRLAALPLGFLLFNLDSRAPWRRGSGVPTAYLGDSGSYVFGILLLRHGAWPALWIPLLDLLRLSVVRWRAGSRPWVGDRRHLAHRLAARGLRPIAVASILAAMTLPGCLGVFLADRHPLAPALGLGLGALIFVFAVRWTPASQ